MARTTSFASYVIWGSFAVVAVLGSAFTIALVVGSHRGIEIAAPARPILPSLGRERAVVPEPGSPAAVASTRSAQELEIARLNDALRTLAAERDRLEDRLAKLEGTLGDITASAERRAPTITGSVPEAEPGKSLQRIISAPPRIATADPAQAPPAGVLEAPGGEMFLRYTSVSPFVTPPSAAQAPMHIRAVPPARDPASPARQATAATRTDFAVDLGTESTMEGLRARWTNLRAAHNAVLGNLQPVVALREGGNRGVELRLVAGPLSNASDAARVCASLQARGVNCQTTVFDGQRLAAR